MQIVRLEDYERDLEARLRALGYVGRDFVLPNCGAYRTESKRELLRSLSEQARTSGRETPWAANI